MRIASMCALMSCCLLSISDAADKEKKQANNEQAELKYSKAIKRNSFEFNNKTGALEFVKYKGETIDLKVNVADVVINKSSPSIAQEDDYIVLEVLPDQTLPEKYKKVGRFKLWFDEHANLDIQPGNIKKDQTKILIFTAKNELVYLLPEPKAEAKK
jgi:hypothetical protein